MSSVDKQKLQSFDCGFLFIVVMQEKRFRVCKIYLGKPATRAYIDYREILYDREELNNESVHFE